LSACHALIARDPLVRVLARVRRNRVIRGALAAHIITFPVRLLGITRGHHQLLLSADRLGLRVITISMTYAEGMPKLVVDRLGRARP